MCILGVLIFSSRKIVNMCLLDDLLNESAFDIDTWVNHMYRYVFESKYDVYI